LSKPSSKHPVIDIGPWTAVDPNEVSMKNRFTLKKSFPKLFNIYAVQANNWCTRLLKLCKCSVLSSIFNFEVRKKNEARSISFHRAVRINRITWHGTLLSNRRPLEYIFKASCIFFVIVLLDMKLSVIVERQSV